MMFLPPADFDDADRTTEVELLVPAQLDPVQRRDDLRGVMHRVDTFSRVRGVGRPARQVDLDHVAAPRTDTQASRRRGLGYEAAFAPLEQPAVDQGVGAPGPVLLVCRGGDDQVAGQFRAGSDDGLHRGEHGRCAGLHVVRAESVHASVFDHGRPRVRFPAIARVEGILVEIEHERAAFSAAVPVTGAVPVAAAGNPHRQGVARFLHRNPVNPGKTDLAEKPMEHVAQCPFVSRDRRNGDQPFDQLRDSPVCDRLGDGFQGHVSGRFGTRSEARTHGSSAPSHDTT